LDCSVCELGCGLCFCFVAIGQIQNGATFWLLGQLAELAGSRALQLAGQFLAGV